MPPPPWIRQCTHLSARGVGGFFFHCLVMGWSRKWLDLRSSISKIRDIQFVGIQYPCPSLFASCKSFSQLLFPLRDVELRKTWLEMRLLKVTWGRDLLRRVKKIRKCVKMIDEQLCQFSRRYVSPFFLSSKNLRGGGWIHAPSVRGLILVKSICMVFYSLFWGRKTLLSTLRPEWNLKPNHGLMANKSRIEM